MEITFIRYRKLFFFVISAGDIYDSWEEIFLLGAKKVIFPLERYHDVWKSIVIDIIWKHQKSIKQNLKKKKIIFMTHTNSDTPRV